MHLINETAGRTTTTPAAVNIALAGPSQGSEQLSTWRVRMQPDLKSPLHLIDHDQVWMPVEGTFAFTAEGTTITVSPGQAVVVKADEPRQFHAVGGPAEALVCMMAGGRAGAPGTDERHPLPWAL